MFTTIVTILLWFTVVSSGLMAGVYFTFSVVIMPSLGTTNPQNGAATMNAINRVILWTLFMPLFFGSSLVALLLVAISMLNWHLPQALGMFIAGVVYVVGMFLCTVFFNVPLNNQLISTEKAETDTESVWMHYLESWTRWNHVRSIACLLTFVLSVWTLLTTGS